MNPKPSPRGKPRTSQKLKGFLNEMQKAWEATKPQTPMYLNSQTDPRLTRSMNKRYPSNQLTMSNQRRKPSPLLNLR